MIPKSGNRFSEKIMRKQKAGRFGWAADLRYIYDRQA
jgi:hypothetical protein